MIKSRKSNPAKDKPDGVLDGAGSKLQLPATPDNNIRNWRLFRKYPSQEALAKATIAADPDGVGVARGVINRLESGDYRYHQDHIRVLSLTLKCSPRDLIGTNPFDAGDIFVVYAGLSEADKRRALKLLSQLKK